MKRVAPLVLLAVLANPLGATTIVVLRTPDYIMMAADSRMMATGQGVERMTTVCKIYQQGSMVSALAGIWADNFIDLRDTAREAMRNGSTIQDVADRFEKAALRPLAQLMERLRSEQPQVFRECCNNKEALSSVFVEVQAGVPMMSIRFFWVATNGTTIVVTPRSMACPGSDCPTGITDIVLGHRSAAERLLAETPHFWRQTGIVMGANSLIDAEIRASGHTKVAGPISIIMIDANGPRWLQPGLCGPTEPQKKAQQEHAVSLDR